MSIYRNFKYAAIAAVCTLGMAACNNEPEELNNPDIVFELLDVEGKPVSGTQAFTFGESVTYGLNARHIGLLVIEKPEGWDAEVDIKEKTCTIIPPVPENLDGAAIGEMVFNVEANRGLKKSFSVNVSADELSLGFEFDAPAEVIKFAKNQTRRYEFSGSGSFSDIEFDIPDGWTAELRENENFFTLTSPLQFSGSNDVAISVIPVSVRGEKGQAISFTARQVDTSAPDVIPETENARIKVFTAKDISINNKGAAKIDVLSKPGGWTVTPDIPGNKITIVPPSDIDAAEAELEGTITFKAWEPEMLEDIAYDFSIDVGIDGIMGKEGLDAFRNDYYNFFLGTLDESELDKWMSADGEIVLLTNVEGVTEECCITGNGGNNETNQQSTLVHTFNGLGHTIELNISTAKLRTAGLCQQVTYPGEVKNLNVTGQIECTHSNTDGSAWQQSGGVASFSRGGRFTNIVFDVDFIFNPTMYLYDHSYIYGGIVGRCRDNTKPPTYITNCHTKGTIDMTRKGCFRYFGGQVGYLDTGCPAIMTGCTNSGDINYTVSADTSVPNIRFMGGLVGWGHNAVELQITDCSNSGNITSLAGGMPDRPFVGGIAGRATGIFRNCVNTGNITSTGSIEHSRMGGIVGAVEGTTSVNTEFIDCHNRPDATDSSKKGLISGQALYMGGIVGSLLGCKSSTISGCTNKGDVINPNAGDGNAMGGIAGFFRGNAVIDCINEGRVAGNVDVAAAGIIGIGEMGNGCNQSNPVVINNCINKGELDVTTTLTGKSTYGWLPLVGGILTIGEANKETLADQYFALTDCVNQGQVKSEVTRSGCARNIWTYWSKHRADDPSAVDDTAYITADTSTATAQTDPDGLVSETVKAGG